jgi:hypothetical protein
MKSAAVVILLLATASTDQTLEQSAQTGTCATSPLVTAVAPNEPEADPGRPADWYMNADGTIWAGPVPNGGWPSGGILYSGSGTVKGQKTYWVRPKGTQLVISGRRLDTTSPPVEAHIPCCYGGGFQIVGLYFPSEGCWEVNARAGESELRFVTYVSH